MNDTVLALVCALAIYGLAALALPRPGLDPAVDPSDFAADSGGDETADAAPAVESSDDQIG